MVTADETVLATTTNTTTPISAEPTEPKSSDDSSDSESDKIEFQKLKAEQREVLDDAIDSLEVNGNEENGKNGATAVLEPTTEVQGSIETSAEPETAAVMETAEDTEVTETAEISIVENNVSTGTPVIEEIANGSSASTSEPQQETKKNEDDDIQEIMMDTVEKVEENGTEKVEDDDEIMEIVEESAPSTKNGVQEKDDEDAVVVLDDDEPLPALINGNAKAVDMVATEATAEDQNGKGVKRAVEFIQLDDDDDDIQEVSAPVPKKAKVEEVAAEPKTAEPDTNESAQKRLLDKLEEYVTEQKQQPSSKTRKVLDTLLGAINSQVQKEPLSVRKLILDKVLVLPNTITFPPSQVCDLLIEHDPDMILAKVITRMHGEERPKLSDSEKRERALLKQHNPVPNMTKLLVDIGQDLVQEATYCDIVHAKNLPEVPKNLETYKQVAAQLKPVWETLKRKNEPYKMKMSRCGVCGFQTESKLVMTTHKQTLHHTGTKFQCTFCKETDTNEQRMKDHYFEAHLVIAIPEEKESKYPCAICEEDFNFKGVREQHYKQCKRDYIRIRNIMVPKQEDQLFINRWLWERPPIDPSILQQQQQAALQQAQQKKQQQQLLVQQQAAQAAAAQLLRKQQMQQQQQQQQARLREQQQQAQFRQMAQILQQQSPQNRNMSNTLIAAMQQQLRRSGQNGNQANVAKIFQQQMAAAFKSQQTQQLQAAMQSLKNQKTPVAPKTLKSVPTPSASTSISSAGPPVVSFLCEICDSSIQEKDKYLSHLQSLHKQMVGKSLQDMAQGAPLACSRCRDRFWTYEGLERHLVMSHGLVTADLLLKAQRKEDGGRCKTCGKQYAFNMLQHLVADHQVKLCSAEIMYSCDVCAFKCSSYQILENHLSTTHPKGDKKTTPAKKEECITLDD